MARICLVSHNASGAFQEGETGHIGGVERQTQLLARWLADRGHDVIVITWLDGDLGDWVDPSGVKILGTCEPTRGIRWLRFFHPKWTSLISALRRADADVYYHNAAESVTGQIAMWCRLRQRRFVYSVASEPACKISLPTLGNGVDRMLYRYAIRTADAVVVQTQTQQQMLQESFGKRSTVLPMPCKPPSDLRRNNNESIPPKRAIWIGRLVPLKRLEMLLEVARMLPSFEFDVIASANQITEYARSLMRAMEGLGNVRFIGRVSYDSVWQHYSGASTLVCTSEYEGFPNTFLEAMACGLPIVSTIDPDGVIAREQLGLVATGAGAIARTLTRIHEDQELCERFSENARRFFLKHHESEAALPRFERLLVD